MSAASQADFTPPDNRSALVESGLRRFIDGRRSWATLATDKRRSTPGWRGLTDPEVLILEEHGYATAGEPERDGRRFVALTELGKAARDALMGRSR